MSYSSVTAEQVADVISEYGQSNPDACFLMLEKLYTNLGSEKIRNIMRVADPLATIFLQQGNLDKSWEVRTWQFKDTPAFDGAIETCTQIEPLVQAMEEQGRWDLFYQACIRKHCSYYEQVTDYDFIIDDMNQSSLKLQKQGMLKEALRLREYEEHGIQFLRIHGNKAQKARAFNIAPELEVLAKELEANNHYTDALRARQMQGANLAKDDKIERNRLATETSSLGIYFKSAFMMDEVKDVLSLQEYYFSDDHPQKKLATLELEKFALFGQYDFKPDYILNFFKESFKELNTGTTQPDTPQPTS